MNDKTPLERVKDLDPDELKIIYLRCEGRSPAQIMFNMEIEDNKFYKVLRSAYNKLEVPDNPSYKARWEYVFIEYCELVKKVYLGEEVKEVKEVPKEKAKEEVKEEVIEENKEKTQPLDLKSDNKKRTFPVPWKILVPFAIIGCLVIVGAFAISQLLTGRGNGQPGDQSQPDQVSESEMILFSDDFSDGLDSNWQSVYGDTDMVNDQLTFSENTLIVLDGSEDWQNYRITFDLSNTFCQGNVRSSGVSVVFLYQDPNNMAQLSIWNYAQCYYYWLLMSNGELKDKPNSDSPIPQRPSAGVLSVEITVEGNFYQVIGGPKVQIDEYNDGRIGLFADPGITIDNFLVVALP